MGVRARRRQRRRADRLTMGRIFFFISRGLPGAAPQRRPERRRDRHDRRHHAALGRPRPGPQGERGQDRGRARADRAQRLPLRRRDQGRDRRAREGAGGDRPRRGVDFVSKAEAVEILQGRVKGDLANSIDELNSNPLPASFAVDLDDPDNLERGLAPRSPPPAPPASRSRSARSSRRSRTPARRRARSARHRRGQDRADRSSPCCSWSPR